MGIATRDLTPDDAAATADLMARIEVDHPTGFCLGTTEVLEIMRDKPDSVFEGAFDGDDLVAYTTVMPGPPHAGRQRFVLFGDVDPARLGEGIGTLMLRRSIERARRHHVATAPDVSAHYAATALSGREDQADLMRSAGMVPGRHSFLMVADLAAAAPGPSLPGGITVGPFREDAALELLQVHNRAFADHPGRTPTSEGFWSMFMVTATHARHDLSAVARDADGQVAAYVFAHQYAVTPSGRPGRELHVPYVGTVPEHRGRGLASGLLAHVLHLARGAGYDTASLNVDTANPTGALGIYERAGFEQVYRQDSYTLEEPPA